MGRWAEFVTSKCPADHPGLFHLEGSNSARRTAGPSGSTCSPIGSTEDGRWLTSGWAVRAPQNAASGAPAKRGEHPLRSHLDWPVPGAFLPDGPKVANARSSPQRETLVMPDSWAV